MVYIHSVHENLLFRLLQDLCLVSVSKVAASHARNFEDVCLGDIRLSAVGNRTLD